MNSYPQIIALKRISNNQNDKTLEQQCVQGFCFCGEGGIRTHDTLASIQTFQACSFGHSDTSPFGRANVTFFLFDTLT